MPKISPGIPNELLFAHVADRDKLSDALWIIAAQVAMLLARSVDQLDEDRKVGNPPPAMKPWGVKGPVRYKLGSVRDFMFGSAAEEYNNTEHARQGIALRELTGLSCFEDFLSVGRAQDVWPITIHRGIPIDFFRSLGLGEALTDADTCEWMTLDRYLECRRDATVCSERNPIDDSLDRRARGLAVSNEVVLSKDELSTLASVFSNGSSVSNNIYVAGDPPFPGRGAFIMGLVQTVATHLGFHGNKTVRIEATTAWSRIHLTEETLVGPFHEFIAKHSPSRYLWYCQAWTLPLKRVVLEASKSQIASDHDCGATVGVATPMSHFPRTELGSLIEAIGYQVPSFDSALVAEFFPGLGQAVELIYGANPKQLNLVTVPEGRGAVAQMNLLYAFLKHGDCAVLALPPELG